MNKIRTINMFHTLLTRWEMALSTCFREAPKPRYFPRATRQEGLWEEGPVSQQENALLHNLKKQIQNLGGKLNTGVRRLGWRIRSNNCYLWFRFLWCFFQTATAMDQPRLQGSWPRSNQRFCGDNAKESRRFQ